MASDRQNLQDAFLNQVRKTKTRYSFFNKWSKIVGHNLV